MEASSSIYSGEVKGRAQWVPTHLPAPRALERPLRYVFERADRHDAAVVVGPALHQRVELPGELHLTVSIALTDLRPHLG